MFFRRLEVYTEVPPTMAMKDIILQIMDEVISVLGIATMEIKEGRMSEYFSLSVSSFTEWFSEKYTKKLIGRTDIEDVLRRLDKLTQEEARMAVAENLKASHPFDERVQGIAETAVAVDNRVTRVDDKVTTIIYDVQEIAQPVDDVDQVKRSSSPHLVSTKESYKPFQKNNCGRKSINGFPHRIRRQTITLRVVLITRNQQPGFFKEASFRSGNPQVHFFGSTENVCPVLFPT